MDSVHTVIKPLLSCFRQFHLPFPTR